MPKALFSRLHENVFAYVWHELHEVSKKLQRSFMINIHTVHFFTGEDKLERE